ncbi:MAG TPA: HAMP domain-containing sensor histidine kinase [Pilimelia sp.]|nr:HAMP domain-containing sensor histidine kinase [Pilimelia sp.]
MRLRLTLLVTATTTLVLVAFVIPLALLLRSAAEDRAVNSAIQALQGLVPLVATGEPDVIRLGVQQTGVVERPVTVFLPDGTSLGAPAARTPAVELAARGRSFTVTTPQGREVVLAVVRADRGVAVLRTVVPDADLHRGVGRASLLLAGLGVVLIGLGVLVADRLARALVRPIVEVSAVSHRLAAGDLSARAEPAGPPELRGVAMALNHLAGRIQELLQQERETLADLSHRLRTPLTALRLEAEALSDPDETARITDRVDAVERAVTGLIRRARRSADEPAGQCDAVAVVRERVAFWSVLAEDTDRPVTLTIAEGPLPVAVGADDLAAAVDAVLGNVFAHTPDGTAFAVHLAPRPGGGAELTVVDEGPGLVGTPGDPAIRGASGGASTGLGLDIAGRAAQASGGAMRLAAGPTGGARVTLELGPGTLTGA